MKAVIYGAGNIGRGFIGQLFFQSGYDTVFIDIDKDTVNRINRDGQYPVTVVTSYGHEVITVGNVRAVDGADAQEVVREIEDCDILATSVGANVLKFIAPNLALAAEKRIAAGKKLNILLCENLLDANDYLKKEMSKYMSVDSRNKFDRYIGLVEASIGRMVPVLKKKTSDNPLNVNVEEFDILHLDKDGFVGEIPDIKNILPYAPFAFYMQRKLFIHNMCHAMCAYLGAIKGYSYINQAINDAEIKYLVNMAGISSARAICKENNYDYSLLQDFLFKLLYRFNNSELKDTVQRVAKDPVRKIHKNDRIVGALILCKKYGVDDIYIKVCIAALLCYQDPTDASCTAIQKEIYAGGALSALEKFSGYGGFSQKDKEEILIIYGYLDAKNLNKAIEYAEKTQAAKIKNI